MGFGFKTFTAGSVLTASDVQNYLMTQGVMYFASTTARDAAITSPVAGMVAYIDSGDVNEGLYTYNGTSWRQGPGWNAPWGYLTQITGSAPGTVLRAGSASTAVDVVSGSYTHVNNRRIRVTGTGDITWTTATNSALNISVAGTTIGTVDMGVANTAQGATIVALTTSTGASQTFKLSGGFGGSNSNVTLNSFAQAPFIILEDIGPSGAPV